MTNHCNMEPAVKSKSRRKKAPPVEEEPVVATIVDDSALSTIAVRGRKPKGGKLVARLVTEPTQETPVQNVILHLKCSLDDLNEYNSDIAGIVTDPLTYRPVVPPNIMTYNQPNLANFSTFSGDAPVSTTAYTEQIVCNLCKRSSAQDLSVQAPLEEETDTVSIKDVNAKLKSLRVQLFKNTLQENKKSACFWCTYDFDNDTCYIPKYEEDGAVCGYGSFCRPECAVAYLMRENIDDSTRFRRYEMLNNIYSKVYGFKKNIKPAPDPYYTLEKFYGNLSIQEYRKLTKSEHMLLVIERPMTRLLPELHEDNDEFILNIYGGVKNTQSASGVYKVKRQSEKPAGASKTSIMQKNFGLTA